MCEVFTQDSPRPRIYVDGTRKQGKLRSDCTNVQSVLSLPCLLMLQGIFSCVIILVIVYATSDCYMQILVTGVCAIDLCVCVVGLVEGDFA